MLEPGPLEQRLRRCVAPGDPEMWATLASAWREHGECLEAAYDQLRAAVRRVLEEDLLGPRGRGTLVSTLRAMYDDIREQGRRCLVTAEALTGAAVAIGGAAQVVDRWDLEGPSPEGAARAREQEASLELQRLGRDVQRAQDALGAAHAIGVSVCPRCSLLSCGCAPVAPAPPADRRPGPPVAGAGGFGGTGGAGAASGGQRRGGGVVTGLDLPPGLSAGGSAWLDAEDSAPGVLGDPGQAAGWPAPVH